MIICVSEFDILSPTDSNYSLREYDYYAWIPAGSGLRNHRLSLRKNLKTDNFEVYRQFFDKTFVSKKGLSILSGVDTGIENVVFKSENLEKAIKFASDEAEKFHGEKEEDRLCKHKHPIISPLCRHPQKITRKRAFEMRHRGEKLRNNPSDNLKRSIQLFVDQVCEKEGWKIPEVIIPSKEEWSWMQKFDYGHFDPEAIRGKARHNEGKIYLNSKYALYRTNVLHELVHYNTTLDDIRDILEQPHAEERPDLIRFMIEMRTESKARRLARKYKREWIEKIGLR